MALSQTDLDKLDRAIARGVLRVEYSSGAVTYQSITDMLKARTFVANEIASSANKNPPSTLAVFGRD